MSLVGLSVLEKNRHLLHVRVKRKLSNVSPLGIAVLREFDAIPPKSRSKDFNGNLSGSTASVPLSRMVGFLIGLFDGSQVGERCNVEIPLQSRPCLCFFLWVDWVRRHAFFFVLVYVFGLFRGQVYLSGSGIVYVVCRFDIIGPIAR
jgi:hypothetical protein